MNKVIIRVLGFLVVLTIYTTVLVALAPVLPIVFLTTLLAWLIFRRPLTHPDHVYSDIKVFGVKAGEVAVRLIELLVSPLTHGT